MANDTKPGEQGASNLGRRKNCQTKVHKRCFAATTLCVFMAMIVILWTSTLGKRGHAVMSYIFSDYELPWDPKKDLNHKLTVLVEDSRRTGNLLFDFAAMACTAWKNDYEPVIYPQYKLLEQLDLNVTIVNARIITKYFKKLKQHGMGQYDKRMENIKDIKGYEGKDVTLIGFFQSWKFFDNCEDRLRTVIKFYPQTLEEAVKFFRTFLPKSTLIDGLKPKVVAQNVTFVGIHVRRGDIMKQNLQKFGYTFPPVSFFKKAIERFVNESAHDVHFVVSSDDIKWCDSNLLHLHPNIHFSKDHKQNVDLAILTLCQDVIMTTGTFGWWAAWLAGGKTIYYNKWPSEGSTLSKQVNHDDFFMPQWIGLD